jgi:protoporphyrinogen/coproporphyrinogen III oxidase
MADQINEVVVLGAGITGLSVAYWLKKAGCQVVVLESGSGPGGSVKTLFEEGFLIEQGPNSGLETTPLIKLLVDEIGLANEMIYANEEAKKRFVLKYGQLIQLPTTPPAFIQSPLFSTKAKLRLLLEPFMSRSKDGYYQSVAQFVKRRLGQEFLDYAIDPFVSGISAGDPEKLSVQSAFPKLYSLEEKYGGLIKGMIKGAKERKKNPEVSKQSAKMFSFKKGMLALPMSLSEKLDGQIIYNSSVKSIEKVSLGYKVKYQEKGEERSLIAKSVVSTIPAHKAHGLFVSLDKELSNHLSQVYYPPVMTLYLGYRRNEMPGLDGFGFLIPSKEKKNFLGAIWNSSIFPGRAPQGHVSFTLFIGGARQGAIFENSEQEVQKTVIDEFQQIMGIKEDPVLIRSKMWKKAIPQYNLGYIEHEKYFEKFEAEQKGIFLAGNYRGGISFSDCIKNAGEVVDRILKAN